MRSYEAARGLFSFLAGCAWLIIAAGAIIAVMAAMAISNSGFGRPPSDAQVMLATIPGLSISFAGFLALAIVQMGRASVDTAEYSQQSLSVSRQHLELSKQLLEQGKTTAASFASLATRRLVPSTDTQTDQTEGASYSNQPAQSAATTEPVSAPLEIANNDAPSLQSISKSDQKALPQPAPEIVYQDGKFVIGDKRFWSKREALEFQESLLSAPAK